MPDPAPFELHSPTDLAAGVPYAYAAVTGDKALLVFTAGACPLDDAGTTVAPGDVAAQARSAMGNLHRALDGAGARLADVVKVTVYVASSDRADLVTVWRVVHGQFAPHEPAATLIGVSVLGYADQLVEVEAVAAVTG